MNDSFYKNLLDTKFLCDMNEKLESEYDGCVLRGAQDGYFFETAETLKLLLSNFLIAYHYGWNSFTAFDIISVDSGRTIAEYKENEYGEFTWQGEYNE